MSIVSKGVFFFFFNKRSWTTQPVGTSSSPAALQCTWFRSKCEFPRSSLCRDSPSIWREGEYKYILFTINLYSNIHCPNIWIQNLELNCNCNDSNQELRKLLVVAWLEHVLMGSWSSRLLAISLVTPGPRHLTHRVSRACQTPSALSSELQAAWERSTGNGDGCA